MVKLKSWMRVFFPKRYLSKDASEVDWDEFQSKIDYKIKNKELFEESIRHRSHPSCLPPENKLSNERLEFLGDAIVNFLIGEFLFETFPDAPEGDLTRMRSILVSRDYMAKISRKMQLGIYLYLGEGEEKTGGRNKSSILSNMLESIIGAIYLDSGYEATREFTERVFLVDYENTLKYEGINYKGDFLEFMQKKHLEVPKFVTQQAIGPDHRKTYTVAVQVGDESIGVGKGKTKKRAEQEASKQAMKAIKSKFNNKKKYRGRRKSPQKPAAGNNSNEQVQK